MQPTPPPAPPLLGHTRWTLKHVAAAPPSHEFFSGNDVVAVCAHRAHGVVELVLGQKPSELFGQLLHLQFRESRSRANGHHQHGGPQARGTVTLPQFLAQIYAARRRRADAGMTGRDCAPRGARACHCRPYRSARTFPRQLKVVGPERHVVRALRAPPAWSLQPQPHACRACRTASSRAQPAHLASGQVEESVELYSSTVLSLLYSSTLKKPHLRLL